jgi:LysM repeat protein
VARNLALPVGVVAWLPAGALARGPRPGAATAGGGIHVVNEGETLSAIAAAHGLDVATLRRLNDIPAGSSLIRAGQRLVVGTGRTHVVKGGETLSGVADLHRVPVDALRAANGIPAGSSLIRAGQRLTIPSGQAATGATQHTVRHGDSLIRIAADYGVRLADLLTVNTLDLDAVIHPGQTLLIP